MSLTAAANFVLMTPGAIALTLIFSVANALLRALVSPNRAVLVTLYGAISCTQTKWRVATCVTSRAGTRPL